MAAPDYVPVTHAERPRRSLPLPPGRPWTASRPGDLAGRQPGGVDLGSQGPDQGYAMGLVGRFTDQLRLSPGEHRSDVAAGCVGVATKRASLFGRAPVIHDLELAFGAFGFLDDAPADLVAWRGPRFSGAAHDYWIQRSVADAVVESTLRLTPAQVRARLADWRTLLAV